MIDFTMALVWGLSYLFLARICKRWSTTVQLHSVFHCFAAVALSTYAFWHVADGAIWGFDIYHIMLRITSEQKLMLHQVAYHSAGYFIGDTIDIYIDHTNIKRKEFVMHHLAAFAGLCTVYLDGYMFLYGLWLLEIGGIVHHIKHAARTFHWPQPWFTIAEVLYHVVYVGSRVLLFSNTTNGWFHLHEQRILGGRTAQLMDVICFLVVYVLVAQNSVWWFKNAKAAWLEMKEKQVQVQVQGHCHGLDEKKAKNKEEKVE